MKNAFINSAQQGIVLIISSAILFLSRLLAGSTFFNGLSLSDIAVCDFKEQTNRFTITYIFFNSFFSSKIMVRVISTGFSSLKTLNHMFYSAGWLEREVFDMFGLFFLGNTNLCRVLTDYGFDGFPLQKDFPVLGFIEKQYSLADHIVISRRVVFSQEFRVVI